MKPPAIIIDAPIIGECRSERAASFIKKLLDGFGVKEGERAIITLPVGAFESILRDLSKRYTFTATNAEIKASGLDLMGIRFICTGENNG